MTVQCIICPKGCEIAAEEINGKVVTRGNLCARGAAYAEQEFREPRRTVTTSVACGAGRLPVKTSAPVPKDKIFAVMAAVKALKLRPPVKTGAILIKNVAESGADIIAAKSVYAPR